MLMPKIGLMIASIALVFGAAEIGARILLDPVSRINQTQISESIMMDATFPFAKSMLRPGSEVTQNFFSSYYFKRSGRPLTKK